MFENGRWYVVGVTSGPDAGYYRDGRVRTDMGQIQTATGHTWARPVTPALEMRWVAQDLTTTLAEGAAVTSWPRTGGVDAWTNSGGSGGVGIATLDHAATPNGSAAIDFPGSARLGLASGSNPVASETSFSLAMVVRVDAAGAGAETNWFDNTGLIDAEEGGVKNDWGLALSSSGKAGFGIGNADTTQYSAANVADGQWRVIVATWDGSEITGDASGNDRNMAIYVDSAENVSRRQGAEFLNVGRTGVSLTLGGSRVSPRFLDGAIAEVRLYRGALDDNAVTAVIRELKSTHIGPQLGLTLTKPASGRATLVAGHGLVIDGSITGASSISVSQISGQTGVVISPANALPAYVSFPSAGIYQINITATGGASSVSRTVWVQVLPDSSTQATTGEVDVGGAWTAVNIGDASTSGALSGTASSVGLTGSGMGFEEVSDSLRFVWKPLTGNGSITGRVAGFSSNNGGKAYGGLMMRTSLRRESANVAATVTSGGGVRFTTRAEDASYTEPDPHTLRAPYWVRVERIGNNFTGFHSPDGVTWTQQGAPVAITMSSSAVWGLAVTSHADNSVSQTSFTNVSLEPLGGQAAPSNSWSGADIGSPVPAGSHSDSGSSFNVNGGGSDIFGTSDKFYFLSQSYSGDARLTARVSSQDRTDPWAKAGVMVRASNAAGSLNAFMAVTPLNGLPWQTRTTNGASTSINISGTANFTAPHWLRLTRNGDTFTCHRSTDGSNWSQLGPARTIENAPATIHAGVMIASLNNSGNSVINVDNLAIVETAPSSVLPEIFFPPGQNPSAANQFTLTASSSGSPVWSWQKVSGPGDLLFRTQNTATPQTAFTQEGAYVIRVIAESNGAASFVDQSQNLRLDARWNFNATANSEGWTPANSSISIANGILTGNVTASDPQLSKTAAVYVSGTLAKHIVARYRSSATGNAQLFWGRIGAAGFSDIRVANFPNDSPANSWQGIIADPSAHAGWNGRQIIDLRFNPTGGTGSTYDLDWLALSDGDFDDDGIPDLIEGGADADNDGLPDFADLDSNGDGVPDGLVPPADLDQDGTPDALEVVRYWNATPRSNTWQTGAADWNTGPLGSGNQGAWNPGDDVIFDRAENYTVTLPEPLAPGRFTLAAGQVGLAGSGSLNAREMIISAGASLSGEASMLFMAETPVSLVLDGTLSLGTAANGAGHAVDLTGLGEMNAGTLRVSGGSFAGAITGASAIIKETGGTLVLTGNNSFGTGTLTLGGGTLKTGFLRLGHPKALGNHTKVNLASNNTGISGIEVAGGHSFNYGIDTAGRNASTGNSAILRNVSGNNTWEGNITITSTGGSYFIESFADSLEVTGTIGVGALSAGTRFLTFGGAGDIRVSGPVTESAATPIALTKSGAGTLRLDAANTFTGAINASGGRLIVNGSVLPAINVGANAVLGGEGTIGDASLTGSSATSPAILSPGDASASTLASTGTVTFAAHSRLHWEVGVLAPSAALFDRLTAGNIAITATSADPLVIEIVANAPEAGPAAVFPIATAANSLTGFSETAVVLDTTAFPESLGTWEIRQSGNTLELVYTPGGYAAWIAGYPGLSDPAADADPDGDGWTNRDEWIAGTDPGNVASRFIATVTTGGGLSFSRIPGRSYVVETTTTLGGWSAHAVIPDGSGSITVPPPDPAEATRFYRVRIELDP